MWIVPGDVAAEIAGGDATPEDLAAIRQRFGLVRPIWERALTWYGPLRYGSLRHSYLLDHSVTATVHQSRPITLSLAVIALFLAVVMGTLSAVLSAVRH